MSPGEGIEVSSLVDMDRFVAGFYWFDGEKISAHDRFRFGFSIKKVWVLGKVRDEMGKKWMILRITDRKGSNIILKLHWNGIKFEHELIEKIQKPIIYEDEILPPRQQNWRCWV